jgi:predicted DNA-binding transcriptional regulator AlpA
MSHSAEQTAHDGALTVEEFCQLHRISVPTLYKLWSIGIGPERMKIGRKVLITHAAARRWREERERATAEAEQNGIGFGGVE